jgi:hypothetical protein
VSPGTTSRSRNELVVFDMACGAAEPFHATHDGRGPAASRAPLPWGAS